MYHWVNGGKWVCDERGQSGGVGWCRADMVEDAWIVLVYIKNRAVRPIFYNLGDGGY